MVINRAESDASDDAKLGGLTATYGATAATDVTLAPGFDRDDMSYTALVPNAPSDADTSDDLSVMATARNGAVVGITSNNDSTVGTTSAASTITGLEASHTTTTGLVDLKEGSNVITIMVRAADAVATETYTLTVTRAAANASDDAKLSALMVGSESVPVSGKGTLSTVDAPTDPDYSTGVANDVSSIAISATPNHSGAIANIVSAPAGTLSHTGGDVLRMGWFAYL